MKEELIYTLKIGENRWKQLEELAEYQSEKLHDTSLASTLAIIIQDQQTNESL